jgi:hypothetical protein
MPTGTGVDAQLGWGAESTVGAAVTVDHFGVFDSETMDRNPTWIEPAGLGLGAGNPQRGARVVLAHVDANGAIVLKPTNRSMGLWWKQCLGSAVASPTLISGTAYKQVHQLGSQNGKSLTVQIGKPEPSSGTVQPFTYRGCKVKSFEFAVSDTEDAKWTIDVDGFAETNATALATNSPVTGLYPFNFSQITAFKVGGTASTASGVVSISSGTAVAAVVKSFSLKCDWGLVVDRWGLGLTDKAEQLPVLPTITFTLDAEFKKSEWYDIYTAKTLRPMQLTFVGSQIASTGQYDTLDLVIAQTLIKTAKTNVAGPGIVRCQVAGQVYWDESNNALQVTCISADSTL